MGYAWDEIGAGETESEAALDKINPYEDWEKVTRPDGGPDSLTPDQQRWQPVYVMLQSRPLSYQDSATALLAAVHPGTVAIGQDTQEMLEQVKNHPAKANNPVPEHLLRFFLFRPEGEAYSDIADGQPLPYEVIEVGPAIPGAFVDQTATVPLRDRVVSKGRRAAGTEVVTAVIDDIMGIANERFRASPTESRFRYFWAQSLPSMTTRSGPTGPYVYPVIGTEWEKKTIDAFLAGSASEEDFYRILFPGGLQMLFPVERGGAASNIYDPEYRRPIGFAATHGTHVADLAAGCPMGSQTGRPIVGVQLPQLATFETWGARLDLFILMAVHRILHLADNWDQGGTTVFAPVVINVSYGTLAGPKDGSGFLEAEIARLVRLRNRRGYPTAVVLPTGNGYRAQTHAEMRLARGQQRSVTLRVQPEDQSVSFLELWIDGLRDARLTFAPPVGPDQRISLSPNVPAVWDWKRNGTTVGRLYVQPRGARTRVIVALCPTLNHADPAHTALPGAYRITIANRGAAHLIALFDVQRDDTPSSFPIFGRQAYLDHETVDGLDPETFRYDLPRAGSPIQRRGTLSALTTANDPNVIIVGGAFDRDGLPRDELRAALYAGSGPTAGRSAPDLAAVSEETRSHPGILAAGTFSGSAAIFAGTSTAAPQVTRAIVDQWSLLPGVTQVDLNALVARPVRPPLRPQLGRGILAFPPDRTRQARRLPD
ncbi:hypothetical protein [Frigidibacter sp. SD6-1]|uniref:hypothetical protein n=1 Tax=Frigidibacter sp. SD6-1 TaxID=3032581 RepID=UPI0024DF9743|nr:hypothetical protein [Frigidibacter sp. SD6-1]